MPRFKLAKGRSVELPGEVGLFALPGSDEGVSVSNAYTDWLVAQGIVTVVDPDEQPAAGADVYDVLYRDRTSGLFYAVEDGDFVGVSLGSGSEQDLTALAALSTHEADTTTAHGLAAVLASIAAKADASSLGTAASHPATDFDSAGAAAAIKLGAFGDGSDGTVTFDGATTVLGLVPAANVYTLTRDLHLAAGTLNAGVTINTAGFRIFCRGTWTWNGTLTFPGLNSTAAAAGAGLQKVVSSLAGAAGGTGVGAQPTVAALLGGNGGAGGSASGGGTAGGAGTSLLSGLSAATVQAMLRTPYPWLAGAMMYAGTARQLYGGAGGSAGAGDGTNAGGGGGAGGGIVCVFAFAIAYGASATVDVHGGNGGAGVGGNAGGGGGGGGGGYLAVAKSYTGSVTFTGTAGSGGAKVGTGVAGSAGVAGVQLALTLA